MFYYPTSVDYLFRGTMCWLDRFLFCFDTWEIGVQSKFYWIEQHTKNYVWESRLIPLIKIEFTFHKTFDDTHTHTERKSKCLGPVRENKSITSHELTSYLITHSHTHPGTLTDIHTHHSYIYSPSRTHTHTHGRIHTHWHSHKHRQTDTHPHAGT